MTKHYIYFLSRCLSVLLNNMT